MKAGPHEACQGLGSPRCAGVHSVRNVSAGPVQPSDCRRPRFHMMEPDAAIRILFFTRHCSRAASPPYPSTVVDFRKAQDRLAKPVQAGSPDSRRASVPVWQNAPILSHHPPVHARYKHSRCSLTHMNPCPPLPYPAMKPVTARWEQPFSCRQPERFPAFAVGSVGEKAAKGIGS